MLSVLFLTQEVTSGLFIAKTRKPHPLSLTGDAGEPLAGFLIGYLSKQNPSKFQCSQPLSVYRKKSSKMHRKIENQRQTITLEKTDLSVSYSRVFPSQHQCRTAGVAVSEAGADRRGSWAPTVSAPQGWASGQPYRQANWPCLPQASRCQHRRASPHAASRSMATSENVEAAEGAEKHQGVHLSPRSPAGWSNPIGSSLPPRKERRPQGRPRDG